MFRKSLGVVLLLIICMSSMSSVIAVQDHYNTLEVDKWYSLDDIDYCRGDLLFNILIGYHTDSPNIINEGWVEYDKHNDRFRPLKVGEACTWSREDWFNTIYYHWTFVPGTMQFHYILSNYTGGEYTPVEKDRNTIIYNISSANGNIGVTVGTLVQHANDSAFVNYNISYLVRRNGNERTDQHFNTWTDALGKAYFWFPIIPGVYDIYITHSNDPNYRYNVPGHIKLIVN
jgi:hypothetical protein